MILTALCGHGLLDMAAYTKYLDGGIVDFDFPAEQVSDVLTRLPQMEV